MITEQSYHYLADQDKEGDMKPRSKWLFISLFILMLGGIGMVILYQQRAKEEAELIRHEQERMALYLVNHYEGVEEIEFEKIENNKTTGSMTALLFINKNIEMEITFFQFNDSVDKYVVSWSQKNNLKAKDETAHQQNLENIKIKYWSNRW
ncbi:hypothetical protein [Streptococcus sp. DD13]|uniref:hypothetical protein n=1 Tax=Streptococcus sp. DD13 TaxID=1777881 RepID=UPI00079C2DB5|nr:hypothetical protein [Streptococcus sp. DD13]KXT78418.1 hypothetical protein STRDD13_00721 [Streptococcus sp. DD13]